jgi:hypothetical protein
MKRSNAPSSLYLKHVLKKCKTEESPPSSSEKVDLKSALEWHSVNILKNVKEEIHEEEKENELQQNSKTGLFVLLV